LSLLRGRARTLTFRVSAEEYDLLAKACVRAGTRSLSEFARLAIFDKVEALTSRSLVLNRDLNTLASQLGGLDGALREASSRIGLLLGPAGNRHESEDSADPHKSNP
jgi:uncharacterized protein (DUF1778 family)